MMMMSSTSTASRCPTQELEAGNCQSASGSLGLPGREDSLMSDSPMFGETRRTNEFCVDAADEFRKTEATYRDSLRVLADGYLKPLLNATASTNGTLHSALTSCFGDLYNVIACHELLQQKIDEASEQIRSPMTSALSVADAVSPLAIPPSSERVSSSLPAGSTRDRSSSVVGNAVNFPVLLLEMTPSFLAAYVTYIMNYEANLSTINEASEVLKTSLGGDAGMSDVTGQLVQGLRAQSRNLQAVDLSLPALLSTPLKRLTNYNMLTQEWIAQLGESGQLTPEALEGQKAIRKLLSDVDHCKEMLRMSEELCDIERRYNIAGLASRESEIILQGQMTKATRQGPGQWKLRPCFILVAETTIYVAKLTAVDGNTRSVVTVPLKDVETIRKAPRRSVATHFGNSTGIQVQWKPSVAKRRSRSSSVSPSLVESSEAVVVATPQPELNEVYLLCDDELEVNTWVQTLSQAINRAHSPASVFESPASG